MTIHDLEYAAMRAYLARYDAAYRDILANGKGGVKVSRGKGSDEWLIADVALDEANAKLREARNES